LKTASATAAKHEKREVNAQELDEKLRRGQGNKEKDNSWVFEALPNGY